MRRFRHRAGFSLVELLVVIAMMALMAALLFPVLDKGKRNALAAYDLNNFKQTMVGMQMYASDNDDFLPQPGWGTAVACWAAGPNIPLGGHPASYQNYTNILAQQLVSFTRGQLYSYLKNVKLLQCPADNILNLAFLQRNIYISSYVWNAAILGFPSFSQQSPSPTFHLRQFSPQAILEWEADETRPFCFNDFSNDPDEGVSRRHDNGPTVGRFDGGAERLPLNQFVAQSGSMAESLDQAGNGWRACQVPAPNALWCSPLNHGVPAATASPVPEPP